MSELQKNALKVKGQEFVLAAQISIMKEQNNILQMQQKTYKEETDKKTYDLEKDLGQTQEYRIALEGDLRKIENDLDKCLDERFKHEMIQQEEKADDE